MRVEVRVEAKGRIKEAVKEKERDDLSPLLQVLLQEGIFLLVSAVSRALLEADAVNCDTILKNAVNRTMRYNHAVNIILEQK